MILQLLAPGLLMGGGVPALIPAVIFATLEFRHIQKILPPFSYVQRQDIPLPFTQVFVSSFSYAQPNLPEFQANVVAIKKFGEA